MSTLMQAPMVSNLRKEVDRILDRFADGDLPPMLGRWMVPIDMYETDDAVRIEAAVPGFTANMIHVTLQDRVLTLRAERRPEPNGNESRMLQREIPRGGFVRQIVMPVPTDVDHTRASYRDGILTITSPKTEDARAKSIAIATPASPA